jgi:hypothetical protein
MFTMPRMRPVSTFTTLLFLFGALLLSHGAFAQTNSTWIGGAGNWDPCPQQGGNALWNTCPNYPDGNYTAEISGGPVSVSSANHDDLSVLNLTIDSGDTLTMDGGYLHITQSSLTNNGSITVSNAATLFTDSPATITFSGTGTIDLQTSDASIAGTGFPYATLVNQTTIEGQGGIGIGEYITNQGIINASGGTLNLDPTGGTITNTGTLEASGGGTLSFSFATLTNTGGTIEALDGGSVIFPGGTITGGTLTSVGSGFLETSDPNGPTLNNVTLSGSFLDVGSFGVEDTVTNNATITMENAQLFVVGNATLTGTGPVIMGGTGNQTNAITTTQTGSVLTNQITIEGAGSIGTTGLTVTNQSLIEANATTNPLNLTGDPLTNTATLEASGGATLGIFNTVNNVGGTIKALTGSVVLLQGNANINGGTLATSGTGTIQSYGGAALNGTTNTVTNTGAITLSSSEELYLEGTINNTGSITLNGSCLALEAATTLTGTGKVTLNSNACFLSFSQSYTLTNQSTIQGSGSIGDSNQMPIINDGSIIANQPATLYIYAASAGFTNNGKLIVNAGSTLDIPNYFMNLSSGTLTGGTYQITGTLQLPGDITSNAGSITLTGTTSKIVDQSNQNALGALASNAAKGALTLAGNQNLNTTVSFSNAGTLKVSKGSTFTVGNSGSYTQTSGKTTVDGTLTTSTSPSFPGGDLFLPAAGSIRINGGSVFGNGGSLAANVSSNGTVTPADSSTSTGTLAVTGNYSQNTHGALDANLASATQFNQLSVSGKATLGGTLNIGLLNGFVPQLNSTFKILSCTSLTGTFTTVNGTSINSSEHFTVQYNSNNVTLQVVSGP